MVDDLSRIRRFVEALARRERSLVAVQILGRLAALAALASIWMVAAVAWRFDRAPAAAGLVLLVGIGTWFAVAWPLLLRWGPAGTPERQARLVEGLDPDLGGRLLAAVERASGPRAGESEAILGLMARRAAARLEAWPLHRVHPARRTVQGLVAALVAWLVVPVLSLGLPGGPSGVVQWWTAGASALAARKAIETEADEATAHVGDLVLRYRYPDYTGLDPKEIPNSTGDVAAPPGTRVDVTARTGEPVEAAGLEAYGRRLDAEVVDEGRVVQARFNVGTEAGTYRMVLYRGAEPEQSRAFAIEPQADLPPDVMIDVDGDGPLEVALDQAFPLGWRARDDYGVRSVHLQVDGTDVGAPLYRMVDRRAEVFDQLVRTPRELGLSPGDRVALRVAAFDNDTISGSKQGLSPAVEVIVLGARGLDRRAAERQSELLQLMIPVLARHLTDPWPAGETSGELAAWGETLGGRYAPLLEAVEAQWDGMARDQHDASVMARVVDTGTELIRYTQVAFTPGVSEVPRDAAFEVTAGLRDEAIVALEDAVLAFHRMIRNRALRDVAKVAEELASAAEQMEAMLDADDADAQEMLARLDQLERMMQQLAQESARLDDGGLREYVNQREGEMRNLMEEIREALARGDLDEARQLMERLAEQLRSMSQGVQDQLEARQGEASDAAERGQELIDELERLEQAQTALQEQTRELREQEGGQEAQEAAELWRTLEQEAEAHAEGATAYHEGLEQAQRPFWERTRAESAAEMADRLLDAIRARDLRGARSGLELAERAWGAVDAALQGQPSGVSGPGRRELQALQQRLARIRELLDQLQQASQQSSPQQREQAQELEQQQRDLQNELQQAMEQAQQLQQDMPVQPQGMQEALEEASQRMEQASDDLRDGQPMQAEGSQGVASQRLKDARQSMQQAMQQAQQQAQAMQQQGQGGEGQQQGDDQGSHDEQGGQGMRDGDLEIPTREEFTTPEAYRRALLEGMEGDVPEEYRAMKKRYYEELVQQ